MENKENKRTKYPKKRSERISYYISTAFKNISYNKVFNFISIAAISFAALILSSIVLFFFNTSKILDTGKGDLRIMVYLNQNISKERITFLKEKFSHIDALEKIKFIPKEEAFKLLEKKFADRSALFEKLNINPLPDAFELYIKKGYFSRKGLKNFVEELKSTSEIEDVNYPQEFIEKFSDLFKIVKISGLVMSSLFVIASVFFVANTISMTIYARREEIEIIRLIGAKDSFIKIPFYIEAVICSVLGACFGIFILYLCYIIIKITYSADNALPQIFNISFLPINFIFGIIMGSIIAGCIGCFISLKRFVTA